MFNFTHTEQELRTILAALEELPHKISRGLIDKLVQGAVAQQPPAQDGTAPVAAAPAGDAAPAAPVAASADPSAAPADAPAVSS